MRTYRDRQYNKMRTLEIRIKDAHSAALIYQSSFNGYLESMGRIFHSKDYLNLPRYRREYLRGIYDTLFHQLQNSLVWVLVGPDGEKYGPNNNTWLDRSSEYKEKMQGEHVWPKAWEKGEFRTFSSSKV